MVGMTGLSLRTVSPQSSAVQFDSVAGTEGRVQAVPKGATDRVLAAGPHANPIRLGIEHSRASIGPYSGVAVAR